LFGVETALVAAALWAFNPMALIVARWARMYSMFIALTLGSLLAMLKVQQRPSVTRVAMFGGFGAAMLYTHLGGAMVLGAEVRSAAVPRHRSRADPVCADRAIVARASARVSAGPRTTRSPQEKDQFTGGSRPRYEHQSGRKRLSQQPGDKQRRLNTITFPPRNPPNLPTTKKSLCGPGKGRDRKRETFFPIRMSGTGSKLFVQNRRNCARAMFADRVEIMDA